MEPTEETRARRRAAERRRMEDPGYRERCRVRKLRSAERRKERDPEGWRVRHCAAQRRYQVKRREEMKLVRQIEKAKEREEAKRRKAWRRRLPAEPFRAWLCRYQQALPSLDTAAKLGEHLRLGERRVYGFMTRERPTVFFSTVDLAISTARLEVEVPLLVSGLVLVRTVEDLYPQGMDTQVVEEEVCEVAETTCCATPGCSERSGEKRFCLVHGEQLARIRAELEAEGAAMSRNGGARRSSRRVSDAPVCCNPTCWYPRIRGERFCTECRLAGWTEDEDGIYEAAA